MTVPSWVGGEHAIPEVDADFGEVALLPSTMKSVKSLTRFALRMGQMTPHRNNLAPRPSNL